MSHQTGIHASEELKAIFVKCKSKRDLRCIKISIEKEKVLVCDETKPMTATNNSDWKQDWTQYMTESFLPKHKPCYVLFRLGGADTHEIVVTNQKLSLASSGTTSANPPPPPLPLKTSKPSIVSKLTEPPKLASLLTGSLSNNNNNNKSSPEADKVRCKYDNLIVEAAKDMWLFLSWSPDASSLRDKMIYASTKSSVKLEFGGGSIFADYFATGPDDLSFCSVQKWIERKQHIREGHINMEELSITEQELHHVKAEEAALCADLLASSLKEKNKSLPNIDMPIKDDAMSALNDFKRGKSAYVQLSIDTKTETILLEKNVPASEFDLSTKTISSLTPIDHARYHLISFSHEHDKKPTKATLFIYSIPSSGCPVKERMLYSSVKNSLLQVIQNESKLGIKVERKIETDDPSELTSKFLYDELYPSESVPINQVIVKPKGPTKQNINATRRRVM